MSSSKIMAYSLDDSIFDGIAEMMQELKTDIATMKESLATKSDVTTLQNSVTSALSGVGGIKYVQRGWAKCSANKVTVTISAVDTTKTFINVTTQRGPSDGSNGESSTSSPAVWTLSNATTLTIASNNSNSSWGYFWEVIEFK